MSNRIVRKIRKEAKAELARRAASAPIQTAPEQLSDAEAADRWRLFQAQQLIDAFYANQLTYNDS